MDLQDIIKHNSWNALKNIGKFSAASCQKDFTLISLISYKHLIKVYLNRKVPLLIEFEPRLLILEYQILPFKD